MADRSQSGMILAFLAFLALVIAAVVAIGGDDSDAAESATDAKSVEDAAPDGSMTGEFLVSGSSTVFPIVNKQAEEFGGQNPGVAIAVEGPGSGDGAKLFCAGDIPIGNASRQYKDSELEACTANGIEFVELRRAIDGISIVTSPENDAVDCVNFDQLYALTSDDAIGFDSWGDANALLTTIGSTAEPLPEVALDIYAPGEESGTFDSFVEIVIEGVAKGKTGLDPESHDFFHNTRPDYNSSPDDNIIIEGISGNQHSLGWVGYAFASEAAEAGQAKLLSVAKQVDGECVAPTPESIAAADFPIARFLYTYINVGMAESDPAIAAFADYMLSDAGLESVPAVGYVALSEQDQAKARELWATRTTGIQW